MWGLLLAGVRRENLWLISIHNIHHGDDMTLRPGLERVAVIGGVVLVIVVTWLLLSHLG
jgi:hypothetical protein